MEKFRVWAKYEHKMPGVIEQKEGVDTSLQTLIIIQLVEVVIYNSNIKTLVVTGVEIRGEYRS